jgi:hypothetical protein
VIRLLALLLVGLAVWRLLARRSRPRTTITVALADGTARRLDENDPLAARILAVADRVAP